MIEELKKCKFKYKFRDYQKRVLDDLRVHLKDEKLNIIAAPGAGKTIFALSLMLELAEPTLIVAPTILLKEQWLDRLKNDFDNYDAIKDMISEDIYNPNLITVTTYQAIYSVYRGKSEKSQSINLVEKLKELKVKSIVLDEAHHLKMSWLDATKSLIDNLDDVVTISLTATPPYDVDKFLWNKYINLCGEVDAEIPVPELVKTKDLAPHQDYIYFNYPSNMQVENIEQYTNEVRDFFNKYSTSYDLITAVSMHDGIINLDSKLDYFIENFEYYDAMISFLRFNNIDIPENAYFKYDYAKIKFDVNKLQILLNYCLYNDRKSYSAFDSLLKTITRELNKIGAVYERKVDLFYSAEVKDAITQDAGKMGSVKTILEFEKNSLKDKLKAVIITEKIYKDLLEENEYYDIKYIGVIPLFRYLSKSTQLKYIVLTGEVIIIPTEYKQKLIEVAKSYNIEENEILMNDLSFNFDYCKVDFYGSANKSRVLVITELFEKIDVEALIGSNALLGEGWDAPFINTLIMATPVSAYVSANQIRGRVIRKYKKDPDKFANIWHLSCVEKTEDGFKCGYDYDNLVKRFGAFEGIDVQGKNISYGIDRLRLKNEEVQSIEEINSINNKMLDYAYDRKAIGKQWFEVLKDYKPITKNVMGDIESLAISDDLEKVEKEIEKVVDKKANNINTIILLSISAFCWLMFSLADSRQQKIPWSGLISGDGDIGFFIFWLIAMLTLVGAVIANISPINLMLKDIFSRSGILNTKNRVKSRFVKAIYKTLIYINEIDSKSKLIMKQVEGELEYYLENSTLKENTLLENSVNEIVSKLDNARYAIKINNCYFQVPDIIGKKNEYVKYFNKYLGGKIIYLKSPEGKRELFNIKLLQNNLVKNITEKDEIISEKQNNISENIRSIRIMSSDFEKK